MSKTTYLITCDVNENQHNEYWVCGFDALTERLDVLIGSLLTYPLMPRTFTVSVFAIRGCYNNVYRASYNHPDFSEIRLKGFRYQYRK